MAKDGEVATSFQYLYRIMRFFGRYLSKMADAMIEATSSTIKCTAGPWWREVFAKIDNCCVKVDIMGRDCSSVEGKRRGYCFHTEE